MTEPSKLTVAFRALQLANEQRSLYGLRYNDFTRYRKHCANRTHRLRSTLKLTHGKGRDFKKLPSINPEAVKDGNLQLLFFEAERAWAYSQELATSSLQPANDDKSRSLRHSATGRFRRAVNWSTQLLSLCQTLFSSSRMSAENLIEVTVYTVILHGRFLRYRDDFEDALIQLSVARGLLDDLVNSASTSRDQALAILFSDEIGPEIRYCAHELGRAKAYDINGIVSDLAPKHRNQLVENCDALVAKLQAEEQVAGSKIQLKKRSWDGLPVPVRYPELVDVLLKVDEAEVALDASQKDSRRSAGTSGKKSKLGVTAYDALLLSLSDAEEVARKLEGGQQLTSTGTSSSPSGGRDIHFVHAYILYQLLSRRIQRDLLLKSTLLTSESGDKSKHQENKKRTAAQEFVDHRLYPAVVKLLDTVLQSLTQMRTLTIVDDYPDLASAVDARISYTNAQRCVYFAKCYSVVKKYAEGLALLQHASIHIRETISNLSLSELDVITNASPSFFPLKADEIKEFESTVASDSLQFKRDWFVYNGGSLKADSTTYQKPLFFNIALNYVELDMDRLQERTGKRPIAPPTGSANKPKSEPAPEKKQTSKAKVEEHVEPTPQPQPQARSGLSSLLGGWWSKTS